MNQRRKRNDDDPFVYVPTDAKANLENVPNSPPKTKYNSCTVTFDEKTVTSLIGGEYGNNYPNNSGRNNGK